MKKHYIKKIISLCLLFALIISVFPSMKADAASVKLNKTKASITVGNTITLKLKNASKVKWNTSDKKVAKVNAKGVVTGVNKGTATITATDKKTNKKYSCKITVNLNKFSFKKNKFEYISGRLYYPANINKELKGAVIKVNGVKATSITLNGDGHTLICFDGGFVVGKNKITIEKKNYETFEIIMEKGADLTNSEDNIWYEDGMLFIEFNKEAIGHELDIYVFGYQEKPFTVTPIEDDINGYGYAVITIDLPDIAAGEYEILIGCAGFEGSHGWIMVE